MPIGPEFNPATAVRALNRPEVSDFPTNSHSYILMINFDCSFLDVEGLCNMKNLTSLAKMHLYICYAFSISRGCSIMLPQLFSNPEGIPCRW